MDIYHTPPNSLSLKFSEGIVAVNPGDKERKVLTPTVIVHTYPVPVPGWPSIYTPNGEQRVFTGAGEYEKSGLLIQGYSTETKEDGKPIQTTSWCISGENLRVVILGTLAERSDAKHLLASIGYADILIPLCVTTKEKRLDNEAVAGIAASLHAQRIIPVGNDESLKNGIAKEMGTAEEISEKYSCKKKDFSDLQTKVILFT